MEITGRLTADAEVRKAKNGKDFTSFTIVVNDSYRTKNGELKETSDFINCTYWQSSKVADLLRKASVVTVTGRIFLNEYTGKDGNKYASLGFHVRGLKIVALWKSRGTSSGKGTIESRAAEAATTKDDLPF